MQDGLERGGPFVHAVVMPDPADELRARVRRAFADAPPPADGDILLGRYVHSLAGQTLELALHDEHWSQLARETLDAHRDSVFTLSAAAYRAYVPAFLLACLDDDADARATAEALRYGLRPLSHRADDVDAARERLSLLDADQRPVLADVLALPDAQPPPTEPVDDELRACIHRAFAHVRPLAADDLLQPRYARSEDPGALAHAFRGAAWSALPVATLRAHADVMFAFSGAGFQAYLPGFLLACVADDRIHAPEIFGPLLSALQPRAGTSERALATRERLSRLDPGQRAAVADFLRYIAHAWGHAEAAAVRRAWLAAR